MTIPVSRRLPVGSAVAGGVLVVVVLGLSGCAMRVGRKTVPRDRFDYSNAIARSWKEQTLLNMVKLRYAEPPVFLEIAQVVATYRLEASADVRAPSVSESIVSAGASGVWAESPTITYTPLAGEQFIKSLLQPVPPGSLLSLVQAGWPVDAVFAIGVRQINGLHAASSTLVLSDAGDADFYALLGLLRELQASGVFGLRVEQEQGRASGVVFFKSKPAGEALQAKAIQARRLIGLDPGAHEFKVAFGGLAQDPKEISMLTRSMLEIMAEASAGVEVPAADMNAGRATKPSPHPLAAAAAAAFHVRVHSSPSKPDAGEAYAAVPYRKSWFWIADNDLRSKRGLGFLMMLFTLAESGTTAAPPVLTISRP